MATAAGNFSPENEYFCRYFRLVNESAVKPLRKIIENSAKAKQLTVDHFLLSQKATLHGLYRRGIIQKHQFDKRFPNKGLLQFEMLDISILCTIIKNICTVSIKAENASEDIRKARNELCHNPTISLSRLDYYSKFSIVRSSIKIILLECQDAAFETDIENEIKNINESPVSVSSILKLFKEFLLANNSRLAQTVAESIRSLEISMADIYSTTEEKLSHLYARVEKQPILTAEAVKNIFLKVTPAKEIETLLKQTEAVLSKKSEYVLTQQFFEVEKMLICSASVVISGGAGEGKTYAAYEIMRRNGQDNNCIQIHSPNDVRFVDPRIFDYVFIDDIFGNHEVDESKLQSWVHVMEQLQQLVNAKAIHLIIATREIVLKECKRFFEKYSIFSNTCLLSSKKLSQEEKIEILASVLTNKNRFFSTEELQRCIMTFSSDLGFPYTCVLFASDDNFFREGSSFFKHNPFLNLRVLTKLNDSKKLSLLFLWIKDGISPVALKRGKENDEVLKKISRMVHYERAIDVLYEEVNDHCKLMNGVFVNEGPYGYQFTHNTVYQSIGHYFARIGHYELILEYSNLAFFMECISVTEDHYRSDQVFIRRELYQNLVDRIIIEVIDRKHYREMAMHSCLIKEILVLLTKALKKRRIMKEFFFTGCCFSASDIEYSSGGTFLSYYLETCAAESCLFLKMLQGQFKCNKRFHKKTCKICCLYLEAYHGACRGGNIEALHELKSVKSDSSMLIDAVYSGNISMYEYIFKDIGQSKCAEHEKRALHISLEQQNFEMYTVMRKLGCNPDSKCLLIASKARNSKLLVDVLLEMNLANALEEDRNLKYVQSTVFSIEVLEALALVKLCPTKNDIVRSMTLDIESVESILWDLKYKVKEKERNVNEQIIQLWKDITEDQDLREKLEDIGLFDTYSLLARQVQKGHPEKVTQILEQLRRKEDLDLNNSFAHYLLNLSLKNDKKNICASA